LPPSPQPCQVDPCAASAYPVAYAGQTPEPYAYGSQSGYGYGAGYGYDYAPHAAGSSNLFYGGRLYGSLGAAMYKIEAADLDTEAFGVQARLGYDILPYLSAEIEGAIGVVDGSGEETLPTTPPTLVEGDIGVDYSVGVFGVGRLPVSPELGVFGRVGYHEKKLSIDTSLNGGPVTSNSDSVNGLAYGGGLEYNLTQSDALRADFTRYETDIGDIDSVSVAYLRRF
jgi:opacity protein-like surface antigen